MYLSDFDIKKALKAGDIIIRDFDKDRLGTVSYDILLGNKFLISTTHATKLIDPANKHFGKLHEVSVDDGEEFILHPGVSLLGTSKDYFGSKKYLVQLHGKSSLARIGLLVHNTAGLINPGHFLNITLELCNLNRVPIVLRPGMEIGQITFCQLTSPVQTDYAEIGRYYNNDWNGFIPPNKKKAKKATKKASKK